MNPVNGIVNYLGNHIFVSKTLQNMPENANMLYSSMMDAQDPQQVPGLARFFRTGPGEYGEGTGSSASRFP